MGVIGKILAGRARSGHAELPETDGDTPFVASGRVAIMGWDYPGLRPAFEVEEGASVRAGQVLLRDRRDRDVILVVPCAGRVVHARKGRRATLSSLVIATSGGTAVRDNDRASDAHPPGLDAAALRHAMLSTGLWPAFRVRPFGGIPGAADRPSAIIVTTVPQDAAAPDPRRVIAGRGEDLRRGIEALVRIAGGAVHVCQPSGAALVEPGEGVQVHLFRRRWPETSVAWQVGQLHPVSRARPVWTIGVQDVLALGELARTGCWTPERLVAIAGPGPHDRRLVRTLPGASLRDLVSDARPVGATLRVTSGSGTSGREAAFVGRFDDLVRVTP